MDHEFSNLRRWISLQPKCSPPATTQHYKTDKNPCKTEKTKSSSNIYNKHSGQDQGLFLILDGTIISGAERYCHLLYTATT